jgi:hypothetical protein
MPKEWRDNTAVVIDTLAHPYFNWLLQNTLSFLSIFERDTALLVIIVSVMKSRQS